MFQPSVIYVSIVGELFQVFMYANTDCYQRWLDDFSRQLKEYDLFILSNAQ